MKKVRSMGSTLPEHLRFFPGTHKANNYLNKARNSHKPRLGEYVQQGNIRSITYIVRGGSFLSFIQKIALKKHFEKKLVFKYLGSDEVEKKSF